MSRVLITSVFLFFAILMIVSCSESDSDIDGDDSNIDGDDQSTDGDESESSDSQISDGDEDGPDLENTEEDINESDTDSIDAENIVDGDEDIIDEDPENGEDQEFPACEGIYVNTFKGFVVDENGAALSGIMAVLCVFLPDGQSACLNPAQTGDDGSYNIRVLESRRCMTRAVVRVISPDDPAMTIVACPVDLDEGGDVVVSEPIKLVSIPASDRDPLGDESLPHEIRATDGTTLTVIPDQLQFYELTYNDVHIYPWPDADLGWPCFIDSEMHPSGLVALVPEIEISANDGAMISFPNTAGLEPGTKFDLWTLGGVSTFSWSGEEIEEGSWVKIGSATISSDGTRVNADPENGLPFLTWIGWSVRP